MPPVPGPHSPGQPGSGAASANLATATPLGISTAPPSMCSTCTLRASALTAIRAVIRSSTIWSTPCAAASTRDRVIAVWKVATTGPRAESTASIDRLSVSGSCTCSTSKSPRVIQRRTRAVETGPNAIRATDPLYGSGTARPADTTYGGSGESSSAGASTLTSCPSPISASARSMTWFCTPPGTSKEYGHTMPIRIAPASSDRPGGGRRPRRGRAAGRRRWSSHIRCNMCQSSGCRAMPAARPSAIRWVSSRTRWSSGPPSGSGSGSGPSSEAHAASGSYHIEAT